MSAAVHPTTLKILDAVDAERLALPDADIEALGQLVAGSPDRERVATELVAAAHRFKQAGGATLARQLIDIAALGLWPDGAVTPTSELPLAPRRSRSPAGPSALPGPPASKPKRGRRR